MLLARLRSARMTETAGEVAGAVAPDADIAADGVEAIEELLQRLVRSVAVVHVVRMLRQVAAIVVVVVVVLMVAVGNRLRLLRIIGVFLLDAVARARARARARSRTRCRTVAREHVIGIVVLGHCRRTQLRSHAHFTLHSNHFADHFTNHFTNHFADALQNRTDAHNKRDTFGRPKRYAQLISPGYCSAR